MCLYMFIVFTVSQFHADIHLVYLVFDFVWHINSIRKHEYMFWWDLKSSERKEPFKFHFPYSLLICSISACSQHQYLLSWLNFYCVYHFTCRKKEQKKEKRKKEPFFSNRELLSTRKHWTINPSLAQAHHRHYWHTAFISFQNKIFTPFRKLSTKTKSIAFKSFFALIYSKYHFNFFLCVKIKEKLYSMRSQDVVGIMHWNCLAWQQSTSSGHPFFHPKPRNCPNQIDPFPARNNPSNACLCVLTPALLGTNRVSPLNETLFQLAYRQMKWRLAHCT